MTQNQETHPYVDPLLDTKSWITKALPTPKPKDFDIQFGVMCEEVGETLNELSAVDGYTARLIIEAKRGMEMLGKHLKESTMECVHVPWAHRKDFLDGLCDVVVTAVTSAHTQKMDIVGAAAEVNRANFSKFVNGEPIFNEFGKVAKGPNYSKADLTPFV